MISSYLELILLFSQDKFKVETEEFLECFDEALSIKHMDIIKYINDEIVSSKIQKLITVLIYFNTIAARYTVFSVTGHNEKYPFSNLPSSI